MIDTHAHINFEQLSREQTDILERAKNASVSHIINIGASLITSQESITLAQTFTHIFASVGVHPDDCHELEDASNRVLWEQLAQQQKVVAIGEIGLDYYRLQSEDAEKKDQQKRWFRWQLQEAKKRNLPIIVHSRNSAEDTLAILDEEKPEKVVMHCYAYDTAIAQRFLNLNPNYMISFTGIITFPNAKETQDVVRQIPLERIMIETDCPFLAPQAYRGQTNEPAYVVEVAKKIAELKHIPLSDIAEQTTKNAKKFFEITS